MASFREMPNEVITKIFLYLNRSDLLSVRLVCQRFMALGCDRRLIEIKISDGISLEKLDELLSLKQILKNVSKLTLTEVGYEYLFSLKDHFEPIKMNCCNLAELALSDLFIEKGISVEDIPTSVRILILDRVRLESEDDFFCHLKQSKLKLEELFIEEARFSCFVFLRSFGATLKSLYLKDIKDFTQMHFNLLKSKLPQLESLVIDSKYDIGDDFLSVVSTFKKLNSLSVKASDKLSKWTIKRLKDLKGLDDLESLTINNLELSEDDLDEMPIFPCLKTVSFTFKSFTNEFCLKIVEIFPVLSSLNLVARSRKQDLKFSMLQLLGSHPTLNSLYFKSFHILPPDQDEVFIEPPSKISSLGLYYCLIENDVAFLIGRYFDEIVHLRIGVGKNSSSVTPMLIGMKKLIGADFIGRGITDAFLESFIPCLPETIQSLTLNDHDSETAFGNRSIKTIANHIPLLKYLTLRSRNVTGDGFFELIRLKNLVRLDLKSTHISADQLQALKALVPRVSFIKQA